MVARRENDNSEIANFAWKSKSVEYLRSFRRIGLRDALSITLCTLYNDEE